MPRPLALEDASDRAGVDVPLETHLGAAEPASALAHLGGMAQEQSSLMTTLHRNLQEPKRLQVKEEHDCCCYATCHAKCFSPSLPPQVAGAPGEVMAVPRATSSHDDNLTAWPKESNDFWGKSFGNLAGLVSNCLPVGWLAIPMPP